ncbi:hypothetical protein PVA8_315 [Vibrio phage PVA8]|nr:hypothetical protein pp2_098 [Vibrio phage phi-pp2]QIW90934.1 hypothetical protein COHAPHLL_00071 [Vibrio phage V09]UNA02002.1 hypothetical protein [Vibrio phage PC-Liy1]URQ03301.1 hypothetical protein PVA8_315 [Vibrio phage PVA8]WBM59034.1 hypothetical protein vBValMPVA8_312 [Vibrio phage vB_ValM_PVA8]WOL25011.1 hypothetical protein [Vibrio phage PG216]
MLHKYSTNRFMNMVNYMSSQFVQGTIFLGFMPITAPDDSWGMNVPESDHRWCAVHLFDSEQQATRSDEEEREQKRINKGYEWLVVLYGTDNTSYMKRFKRREDAIAWFFNEESVKTLDGLFFYNS